MTRFMLSLFAVALICTASTVQAASPVVLKWPDLTPSGKFPPNPLEKLKLDQRIEFDNIEYMRSLEGDLQDKEILAEYMASKKVANKSKRILEKQGIDVAAMYKKFKKWQREIERISKITVKKLDGKLIKLAGYLLPLDFSNKGIKEFILVPYVGACIHVPPPPTNQMVLVRLAKSYKVKETFEPVWVSGRLSTIGATKSLFLGDGSTELETGYTLAGQKIEKYTRPKLPPLPEK